MCLGTKCLVTGKGGCGQKQSFVPVLILARQNECSTLQQSAVSLELAVSCLAILKKAPIHRSIDPLEYLLPLPLTGTGKAGMKWNLLKHTHPVCSQFSACFMRDAMLFDPPPPPPHSTVHTLITV